MASRRGGPSSRRRTHGPGPKSGDLAARWRGLVEEDPEGRARGQGGSSAKLAVGVLVGYALVRESSLSMVAGCEGGLSPV